MIYHLGEQYQESAADVARGLVSLGMDHYGQGRLQDAANAFQAALTKVHDAALYFNLATVLDELGEHSKAVDAFLDCLDMCPDMIAAYNNLGVTLSHMGCERDAQVAFKRVIELTVDRPEHAYHRSAAFFNLGKVRKAASTFVDAVAYAPQAAGDFSGLYACLSQETAIDALLARRQVSTPKLSEVSPQEAYYRFSLLRPDFAAWARSVLESLDRWRRSPRQAYVGAGLFAASAMSPALALIMPQTGTFKHVLETMQTQTGYAPTVPSIPVAPSVPATRSAAPVLGPPASAIKPVVNRVEPQASVDTQMSVAKSDSAESKRTRQEALPKASNQSRPIERQTGDSFGAAAQEFPSAKDHNIRIGKLGLDFSAYTRLEFNDNVTSSGVDAEEDFITTVGIDMDTTWELTRFNAVKLTLGASYQKYFNNSDLDSMRNFITLSPDSDLSYHAKVGAVHLELYDKLAYSMSPVDTRVPLGVNGFSTKVDTYGRFVNNLGVRASWGGKRLLLHAGIDRQDTLPQEDQFDFSHNVEYRIPVGMSYEFGKTKKAGLNLSYSLKENEGETNGFTNNDIESYNFTPFFEWKPSSKLKIRSELGYSISDSKNNGTNVDNSSDSTLTAGLSVEHELNRDINHSLSFKRDLSSALTTNSITSNSLDYSLRWNVTPKATVTGGLGYEHGNESGSTGERYDRYTGSLGFRYAVKKNLNMNLNYTYVSKTSDQNARGYDQNRLVFGVTYDF